MAVVILEQNCVSRNYEVTWVWSAVYRKVTSPLNTKVTRDTWVQRGRWVTTKLGYVVRVTAMLVVTTTYNIGYQTRFLYLKARHVVTKVTTIYMG